MQKIQNEHQMASFKLWLLVLIAALVILRIPALVNPILDVDEAIYGLFTRIWFDGGIPYADCVETKPLGIYFFYGVIFSIFGKFNMLAVHAITIGVVGLTAFVIGLAANCCHPEPKAKDPVSSSGFGAQRGMTTNYTGFWAALFYIVFSTTYIPKYIATTIEPIMLLPVVLQYYLWIRFERENKWGLAFLSGMAFSAACIFKYQAGMNLIILIVYIILRTVIPALDSIIRGRAPAGIQSVNKETGSPTKALGDDKPISLLRGFGIFIIGAIPLPLFMVAYLWHAGALDAFIFWATKGNSAYIGGGSESIKLGHQILVRVLPYIASTALVWVLAFVGIRRTIESLLCHSERQTRQTSGSEESPEAHGILPLRLAKLAQGQDDKQGLLIVLWFLLTIIPVSMGKRFYGHYFLLLLPPLCILAAPVAAKLFEESGRKLKKFFVVFWIVLPAFGFFAARFFISDIHKAVNEDNLDDYKPIAAYAKAHTKPSDRILVWGYAASVYWYAERLPATRFFWSDLVTGRIPASKLYHLNHEKFVMPEARVMFMDDLARHKPVYIIDTSPAGLHDYKNFPISKYKIFNDYLNQNYKKETDIGGVVFYRRVIED